MIRHFRILHWCGQVSAQEMSVGSAIKSMTHDGLVSPTGLVVSHLVLETSDGREIANNRFGNIAIYDSITSWEMEEAEKVLLEAGWVESKPSFHTTTRYWHKK